MININNKVLKTFKYTYNPKLPKNVDQNPKPSELREVDIKKGICGDVDNEKDNAIFYNLEICNTKISANS